MTEAERARLAAAAGAAWALLIRCAFIPPYLPSLKLATSAPADIYEPLLLMLAWSVAGVFIYHTVRQLRLIDRLYRPRSSLTGCGSSSRCGSGAEGSGSRIPPIEGADSRSTRHPRVDAGVQQLIFHGHGHTIRSPNDGHGL
mgnify:CR=1 FL=1